VTAVGIWFSWRSPMGLSEEESSLNPPISDGIGRPAGPDAEAMGVLDRGEIITGPPPPGGIPTDAPARDPPPAAGTAPNAGGPLLLHEVQLAGLALRPRRRPAALRHLRSGTAHQVPALVSRARRTRPRATPSARTPPAPRDARSVHETSATRL
jgi:hypothetical protein